MNKSKVDWAHLLLSLEVQLSLVVLEDPENHPDQCLTLFFNTIRLLFDCNWTLVALFFIILHFLLLLLFCESKKCPQTSIPGLPGAPMGPYKHITHLVNTICPLAPGATIGIVLVTFLLYWFSLSAAILLFKNEHGLTRSQIRVVKL